MKVHSDEVHTDVGLVRRLITAQFPQWAALSIEQVVATGTVSALYRLGDDMVVRLPRRSAPDIDREHATLTRLGPHVPVAIPTPLAKGRPTDDYLFEWCVDRWLEGEHPSFHDPADPDRLAHDLATVVRTLQRIDTADAPPVSRGTTLARWDPPTRKALAELRGVVDTSAAEVAWEISLAAPGWSGAPRWVHGDLIPFNLLVKDGRLAAVLDWGGSGLGDPACDLQPAWNLLTADARRVFRSELDADDDSWARGRGWALWTGLVGLSYYRERSPAFAANSLHRIQQVLADISSD